MPNRNLLTGQNYEIKYCYKSNGYKYTRYNNKTNIALKEMKQNNILQKNGNTY